MLSIVDRVAELPVEPSEVEKELESKNEHHRSKLLLKSSISVRHLLATYHYRDWI